MDAKCTFRQRFTRVKLHAPNLPKSRRFCRPCRPLQKGEEGASHRSNAPKKVRKFASSYHQSIRNANRH